jgi:hypothetical protein
MPHFGTNATQKICVNMHTIKYSSITQPILNRFAYDLQQKKFHQLFLLKMYFQIATDCHV